MAPPRIDQRQLIRGLEFLVRRGRRRRGQSSIMGVLVVVAMVALVILRGWTPSREATVVDVMDGDSLVFMQDGERKQVRLYAIDAPEKGQAYGQESRAFTRSLVLNQPVTLKVRDEDRYNRLVSEVVMEDGRVLNHELVRAGLAWWYEQHAPDDRDLKRFQKEARDERRGLWADTNPQPPWDFRNERRAAESR